MGFSRLRQHVAREVRVAPMSIQGASEGILADLEGCYFYYDSFSRELPYASSLCGIRSIPPPHSVILILAHAYNFARSPQVETRPTGLLSNRYTATQCLSQCI
jgi:hypothetical protein